MKTLFKTFRQLAYWTARFKLMAYQFKTVRKMVEANIKRFYFV